ncbi:MAG: WG repeat-containing protein [Bacteroidota bacterium]|nr:WG repeat-containing protein [Bacteroidota bacterium]
MKKFYLFLLIITYTFGASAQTSSDLLPVKIDYKWGFIDKEGNTVIQPQYDFTTNFICDHAKVKDKGKWGVIDQTGKVLVPIEYNDIIIFCPKYIAFKKDSLWGVDDPTGYTILPANYQSITALDANNLMLKKGGLFGVYNHTIDKSIEPNYNGITIVGGDFYIVNQNQKLGLLDSNLNTILNPEYADIQIPASNLFLFKTKDLWGLANQKGEILVKPEYTSYKKNSNAFISFKTKKGGWLMFSAFSGKMINSEEQESFTILNNELVVTQKAHKYGVYDKMGVSVLGQNYTNIHLNENLLLIELNGKWGLAEKTGKIIIPTIHETIFPFRKSVAVFETETGQGLIDNKGKILAQPIYKNIDITSASAKCFKADGKMDIVKIGTPPPPTKSTKGKTSPSAAPLIQTDESLHGHAWLKGSNKKYGLVGHDTILIPFKYDEVTEVDQSSSIIAQKMDYRTNQKMYGYINANKLVDLASQKIGFVNKATGQIVCQPTYWYIRMEDFKSGEYAKVILEGGQQALISKTGKLITEISVTVDKKPIKFKIDYVGRFINGIARFNSGCNINYQGDWETNNRIDGGKWGYIKQDGQILQQPQFDDASDYINDRAIVKVKGLYGLLNVSGTYVLKAEYQNLAFITESDNKYLKVENKKERFGIINSEGKALCNIAYDKIFLFKDGMARVMVNGKYGFINQDSKLVIEAKYDNALDFSEGMAAVMVNKKWGFINKKGELAILNTYQQTGSFKSGLAPVLKDGKIGYINQSEKMVIQPVFSKGSEFNNGMAIATNINGKQILLDTAGKYVIEDEFDEIKFAANPRYAKVREGKEWKLFDKKVLKVITKKSYTDIGEFKNGYAWVKNDEYFNYIDTLGKVVINKKFTAASDFSAEKLAKVQYEGKYGYIGTNGKPIVDFLFTNATDFNSGRAFTEGLNKMYSIIDYNGKHITYDKYINPKPFSKGFALVSTANKEYYFVDTEGYNTFDTQQFESAFPFEEPGIARVKMKKWGLLNTSGFHSLDYKYETMTEFVDGQSIVSLQSATGVMDLDGKMIAEPVFDGYAYLGNNTFRLEKWDAVGYFSMDKNWIWPLKK